MMLSKLKKQILMSNANLKKMTRKRMQNENYNMYYFIYVKDTKTKENALE